MIGNPAFDIASAHSFVSAWANAPRSLAKRLQDVQDIQLTGGCFRRLVISRNNRELMFLMRLCEFVFRSLMPNEAGSGARFKQVLEDEVRMSSVFEFFPPQLLSNTPD